MIELSSTAHEFSLLNGLACTVSALPSLFDHLNTLSATVDVQGFTDTHQTSIDTLGKASLVWLEVASALTLATQTQAEVCRRLKQSETDWLVGGSPFSPRQLDLHDRLMSHGLLLQGFIGVFEGHIQEMDKWVAKAVPALSLLSASMQLWHDTMATCDPTILEPLPWSDLLLRLHQTAIDLDPSACEWLAYKDVSQALSAVRHAGHLLLDAPITAAQHATSDLSMLAKVLTDSAGQLSILQPEQTPSVYQRHLTFAVMSCDSARSHCESLLALMDKSGAK